MGSPTELPVPGRGSVTRRCFRSWPLKSGDPRALVCSQGWSFQTIGNRVVLWQRTQAVKFLLFRMQKWDFFQDWIKSLLFALARALVDAWNDLMPQLVEISEKTIQENQLICLSNAPPRSLPSNKSFTARAMQLSTPLTTSPVKLANAVEPVTVTAAVHSGQSSCRHAGGVAVALAAGTSAGVAPWHPRNKWMNMSQVPVRVSLCSLLPWPFCSPEDS